MIFRALLAMYFLAQPIINVAAVVGNPHVSNQIETALLLVCGLFFLATRKRNLANIALLLGIVAVTVVSAVGTEYAGFNIDRYLRGLVSLVTSFLLLCAEPTERDRDFLLRFVAWLPLAVVAVGLVYHVIGFRQMWYTDFLGVARLQGSATPAGLGSVGYVSAIAAMLLAALARERTYFWLGVASINIVILMLTAARMPLALTLLACSGIYFTMINPRASGVLIAIFVGLPAAGVLVIMFGDAMLARFGSESLSGRDLLWQYLEMALEEHPIFGVGLGHQILLLPERITILTTTIAAHNEYLRLAVETGYIGAALIFLFIAAMCLNIWKSPRVGRWWAFLIVCASFFIYCRTDNAISSGITPFALVLASFAFAQARQWSPDPVRRVLLGRKRASVPEPQ